MVQKLDPRLHAYAYNVRFGNIDSGYFNYLALIAQDPNRPPAEDPETSQPAHPRAKIALFNPTILVDNKGGLVSDSILLERITEALEAKKKAQKGDNEYLVDPDKDWNKIMHYTSMNKIGFEGYGSNAVYDVYTPYPLTKGKQGDDGSVGVFAPEDSSTLDLKGFAARARDYRLKVENKIKLAEAGYIEELSGLEDQYFEERKSLAEVEFPDFHKRFLATHQEVFDRPVLDVLGLEAAARLARTKQSIGIELTKPETILLKNTSSV